MRKFYRSFIVIACLVMAMASISLVGCNKSAIKSVSLDKSTLTLTVGETYTLKPSFDPADAKNTNVTWSSSDATVASVDTNGKVTALKAGTTDITVKTEDGGKTSTCAVTVNEKPAAGKVSVTGITLDPTTLALEVGANGTIKANITPADATDKSVSWTSSNKDVATVDATGKVTAVAKGSADITATTTDGNFSAKCTVTVADAVDSVTISETLALIVGQAETLTATLAPTGATATVTWSSSDDKVATVDATGKVTAVKAGSAVITATAGGKTDTCNVTVRGELYTLNFDGNVAGEKYTVAASTWEKSYELGFDAVYTLKGTVEANGEDAEAIGYPESINHLALLRFTSSVNRVEYNETTKQGFYVKILNNGATTEVEKHGGFSSGNVETTKNTYFLYQQIDNTVRTLTLKISFDGTAANERSFKFVIDPKNYTLSEDLYKVNFGGNRDGEKYTVAGTTWTKSSESGYQAVYTLTGTVEANGIDAATIGYDTAINHLALIRFTSNKRSLKRVEYKAAEGSTPESGFYCKIKNPNEEEKIKHGGFSSGNETTKNTTYFLYQQIDNTDRTFMLKISFDGTSQNERSFKFVIDNAKSKYTLADDLYKIDFTGNRGEETYKVPATNWVKSSENGYEAVYTLKGTIKADVEDAKKIYGENTAIKNLAVIRFTSNDRSLKRVKNDSGESFYCKTTNPGQEEVTKTGGFSSNTAVADSTYLLYQQLDNTVRTLTLKISFDGKKEHEKAYKFVIDPSNYTLEAPAANA